jgi:hypothetical protein
MGLQVSGDDGVDAIGIGQRRHVARSFDDLKRAGLDALE